MSLSWRGRNALVPKRSELSSQKSSDTPFALKWFRVKPGRHFSNQRECFIHRHAYRLLDGFNEGWIEFEGGEASTIKGKIELQTVLQELVGRAG